MDFMAGYQMGVTIAALQAQLSQFAKSNQELATQLQERSDLFERLARQMGWTYSQDQQQWIHT